VRIAYVCADAGVPVFGTKGCSIHVQEVIRALRGRGAEIELFATNLGGRSALTLEPEHIHELPTLRSDDFAAREQAALDANRTLLAALRREGPFDAVYERYSLWSFAAVEYALECGIAGLLEVNAPLIEEQAQYRRLVDRASAERVAERVFGAATALIAVSEEIAAYLRCYPCVSGRVHVIPNAVNPERFPRNVGPSCPARRGMFMVGFVGSLKLWHGLSVLTEAFETLHRSHPDTRLLLVGDGPERAGLLADLSARGLLEAALLTGTVAASEVPGLLASMDVAVAPYPHRSPFYFSPLKVYEYMAAGVPVVASRIGQLERLIDNGVTGLLCAPGDAVGLAAALERLRGDPDLRARLGGAGRAMVLDHFTWEIVATRLLTLAASEPRIGVVSSPQV